MLNDTTIDKPPHQKQNFPVVGIGASAGGLDAFKRFLEAISPDSGMAYVLVQHLAPAYESLLPEILAKSTKLPVHEITDEINIAPDNVYIIPENKILTTVDGVLRLNMRDAALKLNKPIDIFFRSLAETHNSYAVAVVLSGTGFDGTEGLKAIKEFGGVTYAQTPETAIFDAMPQNAVIAGAVDFILPPEDMPQHMLHVKNAYKLNHAYADDMGLSRKEEDTFKQILRVLRMRSGNDFSHYKQPTLRRRIARRMVATRNEDPETYLAYLRSSKDEQEILFNDVLIPVSYFFRDPKIFEVFSEVVIPDVIAKKKNSDSIRVWAAGCSTGEEAYSIAIAIKEKLPADWQGKVQVFASDISHLVINRARAGMYSKQELQSLPERFVAEYFTKMEGMYHIKKVIRDMCVFAVHNFLKDPPFARLDIVSCRNVLIYLDPFLQKKAIATFHYSLREEGILFLGKSESIGASGDLFEQMAGNNRIFKRKGGISQMIPNSYEPAEIGRIRFEPGSAISGREPDFQKLANDMLFKKYTPAAVIINEKKEIVHFHGDTGAFLLPSPGKPIFNILKMAREEIEFALRSAISDAIATNKPVKSKVIPARSKKYIINFEVIPIAATEQHYMILFQQQEIAYDNGESTEINESHRVKELEAELEQLRDDIRKISEQQEAANEELQSANEELLSNSEELQSLNEELETSSEELQSNNEELITVNEELMDRQDQLIAAKMQAEAVVETIRTPLLIIDGNLRVRSANQGFYKYFDTRERDIEGRLLFDLDLGGLKDTDLRKRLGDLIVTETKIEDLEIKLKIPSIGERTLLLNVTRIVNQRKPEGLVLLSFEDITDHRWAKVLQESENRFRTVADSTPVLIWMSDADHMRTFFNKAWLRFRGVSMEQDLGNGWQAGIHPDDKEMVLETFRKNQEAGTGFAIEYRLQRKDGEYRWMSASCVPRFAADNAFAGFVGGCMDIHHQKDISADLEEKVKKRTKELRESESFLQSVLNTTQNLIYIYDLQLNKISFINKKAIKVVGYTAEEITGSDRDLFTEMIHEDDRQKVIQHRQTLAGFSDGKMAALEFRLRNDKGEYTYQLSRDLVFKRNKEGQVIQYLGVSTDITEIKKTNELLLSKNDELAHSNDELASFSSIASHDLKEPLRKIQMFSKLILDAEKKNLSDKTQVYLDRVIVSANRMQQLIDDLISYSRNDSELVKLTKTDLNDIMEQVLEDLRETMEEKQATIEVGPLPTAPILPSQFRQLFHNLISNAIKYTAEGARPHVKIEVVPTAKDESEKLTGNRETQLCKINVSDNGIGFSNEYSTKIFEPFKRLHGKDEYSGTGIGLAICKKIMANHKGYITAQSEPGKGSVFSIYLPDCK